ncbi:MAG: hypothetical protein IT168_16940 [Bryobacterales bacterium]|nr:hypothetical protein [Bryobacterales bacterium]
MTVPAMFGGAIITTGNTSLGVNDQGHLNFAGSGPGGPGTYGVFRAGVGDAISPGCFCEGWGVAVTASGIRTSGFVNMSSGNGGVGAGSFGSTSSTATSIVSLTGAPVTVEHLYGPSLVTDVFQAQVRITNNGSDPLSDLVYRRVMDWDVPPTTFREYVTHQGVTANLESAGGNVRYASDNGFASSNPLSPAGSVVASTVNSDFDRSGPADHGSVFDFAFGDLAPGGTRIFNIFYGSRDSRAGAEAAVAALGANVVSFGQSSGTGGFTSGTPATFLFAFGGVGGIEPGTNPNVPILPFVPAPATFVFPAPPPRRWFDPPFVDSFFYELLGGALFTEVGTPPLSFGFGDVDIEVDGSVIATLAPGSFFSFPTPVAKFRISGISPKADAGDPTAFPTFLDWTGTATELRMTGDVGIDATIPEPSTFVLTAGASLILAIRFRRLSNRKKYTRA